MMRANRFAQVIAMDFAGTDYRDMVDEIREGFKQAIVEALFDRTADDMYWKWAERNLSAERFKAFCDRQNALEKWQVERLASLRTEAMRGGWLTEEEVREIA